MRYSSNAQDDGNSIEAQQKALYRYALDNDYEIVGEYIDRAKTGTNANRPEFKQMMYDAKKHKFDIVLVHKLDRFARNRYDSIVNKVELKRSNVKLISATEHFGDSPEDKMMEGIAEIFAEYYSDNLSREARKGLDIIANKGFHTGGRPPLGYDTVIGPEGKKTLAVNESEAAIVREIFDMYANGYTYNQMAKILNEKGYKTKIGKEFSGNSFNSILSQRKYIGEYVYNRRAAKGYDGRYNSHKQKDESEIIRIPGGVPQIISNKVFTKVQNRLKGNIRKNNSYQKNTNYLLSGKVICGECGYHYQGNVRKSGKRNQSLYTSYRCGNRQNHKTKESCTNGEIERNRLERFVIEQLHIFLMSDEAIHDITELVNEYNKKAVERDNSEIVLYKDRLKELTREIKNITTAIAKGAMEESLIEELNTKTAQKKDLMKKIKSIETVKIPKVNEKKVKKALSKFDDYVLSNNTLEIRHFIDTYVDKVIVYKDKVEVTFKVASAILFNKIDEDNEIAVCVTSSIEREELKHYSRQKKSFKSYSPSDNLIRHELYLNDRLLFVKKPLNTGQIVT